VKGRITLAEDEGVIGGHCAQRSLSHLPLVLAFDQHGLADQEFAVVADVKGLEGLHF